MFKINDKCSRSAKGFVHLILCIFLLITSKFSIAQDEFEILCSIDKGFSTSLKDQIIRQWSSHAKIVCQNPNCVNTIEAELTLLVDQNITSLILGVPYQAQINYSNCKVENFFIDTLSKQPVNQAVITYHISSCLDPTNSLKMIPEGVPSADDIPLLVTYKDGMYWKAIDHYGYTNDNHEYEDGAKKELDYKENSLKFLCEEKGYKVYQIKNATKHQTSIDVKEFLISKGVDVRACMNNGFVSDAFSGRFQMLVEYDRELEIRYILVKTASGKTNIIVRFINRHPTLMIEVKPKKGVKRTDGSGSIYYPTYEVAPSNVTTIKFDEFVDFDYNFKLPPDIPITDQLIYYVKKIIHKQAEYYNGKIKIREAASSGIRG